MDKILLGFWIFAVNEDEKKEWPAMRELWTGRMWNKFVVSEVRAWWVYHNFCYDCQEFCTPWFEVLVCSTIQWFMNLSRVRLQACHVRKILLFRKRRSLPCLAHCSSSSRYSISNSLCPLWNWEALHSRYLLKPGDVSLFTSGMGAKISVYPSASRSITLLARSREAPWKNQ